MNPTETIGGIEFGRCAVCRGRTTVERGGKRCWICQYRMPPAVRQAARFLVGAALLQDRRWIDAAAGGR